MSLAADAVLAGGGEMGALMRATDWSQTPVGPVEGWPQSLRTAVSLLLESKFGMMLAWGPRLTHFYNDAYRPILGATKHPSLGKPVPEVFPEIWSTIGPLFEGVLQGKAVGFEDLLVPLDRNGFLEECYFTFSYSPVRDEGGKVNGVFVTVTETSARVVSERRMRTLRELAAQTSITRREEEVWANAAAALAANPLDLPFALLYRSDGEPPVARLIPAEASAVPGIPAPVEIPLAAGGSSPWPLASVAAHGRPEEVRGPGERAHSALVLPLARRGSPQPYGFLVAGLSERRALDEGYRSFLGLAADQLASGIANARAHQEERQRAEALAELDRAKTAFFSNVSHELRTPLTLMLAPVEDGLADTTEPLPPTQRERQQLVRRNGLRLQRLVNTLLDFARLEAGRVQASFVPTDLSALTRDLASNFDSAMASARLKLVVDCPPLPHPVYVDRAMWEQMVLNLLANAFKYTFEGEIRIALRSLGDRVVLTVEDTGTGIPAAALPRIFDRFQRVEGARGRSHEGTGIGLALVAELVQLHGGTVGVTSTEGKGSTFTLTFPVGTAHLPADRIREEAAPQPARGAGVEAVLAEVAQWSGLAAEAPAVPASASPDLPAGRVLVADDNADMRSYLTRLLSAHWSVEAVADGAQALAAARARPPDLILSDVMMPGLSGLELVRELRAGEDTHTIPVILLSARAGEEATIEGLESGADEYLVKPFTANELLARVGSQLKVSKARQAALAAARAHAEQARELLARAERATLQREEVLAIVSHDLRSPLGAISTMAELLRRSFGDDPREARRRGQADSILRSVGRMNRLVGDLLDQASIDSGSLALRPQLHPLAELVREVAEAFEGQAEENGLTLQLELAPGLPSVPCDKERIVQVLGNLLSNALKHTPRGGRVRLWARPEPGVELVRIGVTDTGPGIPAEAQPHIFDRYWHAAQKRREGHGLGLSISRGIVEGHGGRLQVESPPGGGSTFSFTLPLGLGLAEQTAAVPAPSTAAPALSLRAGAEESFIQGGGEMGALMRAFDWSRNSLGPLEGWPQSLRTSVSTMLRSPYPIILFWGPERRMLYNDPFRPILGTKHPATLGARGHEALAEEWKLLGPLMQRVMETGEPLFIQDGNVNFARREGGLREEAYFTWSYNPTIGETGEIAGLFAIASETTRQVVGDRQLGVLRELSLRTALDKTVAQIFASLEEVLERAGHDVPFSLLYVVRGDTARRVACAGLPRDSRAAPEEVRLDDAAPWPLEPVARLRKEGVLEGLDARFGPLPGGPWPEPSTRALLLPVPLGADDEQMGVLVAGLSPLRALDDEYRGFLQLLARQLAASISSARAYEQERQRSEKLAELDRAKTAFFANVSHEFRTPLTLMLGPLEDVLADEQAALPPVQRERLALVLRNGQRLFKLVNTLLDYSRLEARRTKAAYQPVDLAELTTQLANHFESATRRAGLTLTVDCPPLPEPVWVDVEAWEKVVFNLLSNAIKHTFAGGVTVSLRWEENEARLRVRDTGTGIPAEELPQLFERFHRVEGARSRTHEGSGIGLALVRELVKLHHGRVEVESEVDRGSVFTVSLPRGRAHLSEEGAAPAASAAAAADPARAAPYLQEALGWLPREIEVARSAGPSAPPRLGRVLVADDNADLREYLSRTLSSAFEVEVVPDGQAALEAVQARLPDVVVTDVMMPRMNGLQLLRALRGSPRTRALPVVILSARAGEESSVEGMDAGADDYLAKPFSARELVARVRAALERSRMSADLARQEALAEGLREAVRARDAFLSVAGHELKTPLASFRLQLGLVERGLDPSAHGKLLERLGAVGRQLDQLIALVEGLLGASELAAGQLVLRRERVDLATLTSEVLHEMRAELERAGCAATAELEPAVGVSADPERLRQVLLALLRHGLRGGQGCPLEVAVRREGTSARLQVTGHGARVSDDDRARIFSDFERAVPTRHYKAGLELWVARQLVQAHGGDFELADTEGGGSTFTVRLRLPDHP